MELIILGTSSAMPTLHRGLSSTLFQYNGEIFVFDCGEGTQMQMLRVGLRRGKIRAIFISHLHGDHYYGLAGLLTTLSLDERTAPLQLFAPVGIKTFLRAIRAIGPKALNFPLEVRELRPGFSGTILEGPDYTISAMPLDHTVLTFGYRFQQKTRPGRFQVERARALGVPEGPLFGKLQRGEVIELAGGVRVHPEQVLGPPRPGKSFVYCLDTAFCENAIALSENAHTLVHEATYTEAFSQLARERKHATMAQAATVAKEARVSRLVAVHFSARFSDLRPLEAEGRRIFSRIVMGKDLMRIEL
ncbi:MAG: ribonuclease Z [Deltaproteobacteria bacterium]|nr:MAG: ribonuclease Z [Deltaproteobacteria bacterium]